MAARILKILDNLQRAEVERAKQAIANASKSTVGIGSFNFFAAFDGTGNDRAKVANGEQTTNVSELEVQVDAAAKAGNPNQASRYYKGVGTGGDQGNILVNGSIAPTGPVMAAANQALKEFAEAAQAWKQANPNAGPGDLTASMVGFSRGAAVAVVFAQLLQERGLVLTDGTVVAAPGSVRIAAAALLDPVFTTITRDMSLPDNMRGNTVVIVAQNEYRPGFEAYRWANLAGVTVITSPGCHSDIGGVYDRGIGALMLEGLTGFFGASGIKVGAVQANRTHDGKPLNLHTEININSANGEADPQEGFTGIYTPDGKRITKVIGGPSDGSFALGDIASRSTDNNPTGNAAAGVRVDTFTLKDGRVIQQLTTNDGKPVLSTNPGQTLSWNATDAKFELVDPTSRLRRVYDPVSGDLSISQPDKATVIYDRNGNLKGVDETSLLSAKTARIDGADWSETATGLWIRKVNDTTVDIREAMGLSGVLGKLLGSGGLRIDAVYGESRDEDGARVRDVVNAQNQIVGKMRLKSLNGGYVNEVELSNGVVLRQKYDRAGGILEETVTNPRVWGLQIIVSDGAGKVLATGTRTTDDDGNTTTTTVTPSGVVTAETKGADGTLIGRVVDTPDLNGGATRLFERVVDGTLVSIEQKVFAEELQARANDPSHTIAWANTTVVIAGQRFPVDSFEALYWQDLLVQNTRPYSAESANTDPTQAVIDHNAKYGIPDLDGDIRPEKMRVRSAILHAFCMPKPAKTGSPPSRG